MTLWKIVTVMWLATVYAEYQHKREIKSNICNSIQNNTYKVQCFCGKSSRSPLEMVIAECFQIVKDVGENDPSWDGFTVLQNVTKLTITNTRGVPMKYVPTNALKYTKALRTLDIKYCSVEKILPYAFANLSYVADITIRGSEVKTLAPNAFAHHPSLKSISLDNNIITEINRDVFVDLTSLEQLLLTGNAITTIHDRAFIHLTNLNKLEIDKNSIFSLNSETFSGLRNLQKLELSGNAIEVIGDNTFLPLGNLQYLYLGENKIQMLDEKAFNGLTNLIFLSLSNNKISAIENEKVFEPLKNLKSLNLKDNAIRVIKPEAVAPLIRMLTNTNGQIVLKNNQLSCDCNLDVFSPLMNNSLNELTKEEIHNLQCYPSEEVKQKWDQLENEKTSSQVFEDEEIQENGPFEYYDESDLNGTLFYSDMRILLNCSGEERSSPSVDTITSTPPSVTLTTRVRTEKSTKATSSPVINLISSTPEIITEKNTKVNSKGLLDLSEVEYKATETPVIIEKKPLTPTGYNGIVQEEVSKDVGRKDKKHNGYTTSRLATVSAKPVEHKDFDDHDMASDEAKPDRIKAHRSIQEEVKDSPKSNNAHRHITTVPIFVLLIQCFRVFL